MDYSSMILNKKKNIKYINITFGVLLGPNKINLAVRHCMYLVNLHDTRVVTQLIRKARQGMGVNQLAYS